MDQTLQPQIPGAAPPPVMTSDQIMQHVDSVYKGLPDPVKAALDHAHTLTGGDPSSNGLASVAKPSAPPPMQAGSTPSPFVPGMTGVKSSDLAPAPQTSSPASAVAPAPVGDDGIGPGAAFPAAKAAPPPISTHQAEFNRLTAPQLPSGDPNAHTKMDMGLPGSQQVHNPFLRGLATVADAIGSGLAPGVARFVPGTTAHHDFLINQQKGALGEEQAGAKSAADVAEDRARTTLAGEQGKNIESEIKNRENPQAKQEEAGKTITTDQGIMQWNPQTQRYDIKAGGAPEKETKETGTIHQTEDGTFIVAKPDGTAIPLTIDGKPVKGPAKEKPVVSPEQQFLDEYKTQHPGSSVADAEKAFKQLTPKEAADRGQNFIDPTTHQLVRIEPGGKVPEGALTAGTASQQNAAADKKTQAAKDAEEQATDDYSLMQEFAAHPSPTNDLAMVMHFIGATKPESLGKLRLNTNEMKLVFGTRSSLGDVEALGQKLANGKSLTPKQRQDMLDTMKTIADGTHARAGGTTSGATGPQKVTTQAQFDALPKGTTYTGSDGKQYKKP